MSEIALSGAMRANLLSLQNTTRLLDETQFKLSTGRKVNSALDDALSFFGAQSLSNRASDLSMLLDSMGQSIQTIKYADTAVTSLTKMIEQAEALATEAKDRITTASGQAAATGDKDIESVTNLANFGGIDTSSDELDISIGSAADSQATSSFDLLANGDSAGMLAAKINDDATLLGKVDASFTAGGALEIKSLESGSFLRLVGETNGNPDGLSLAAFESLGLGDFVRAENDGANTRVAGTVVAGTTISSKALESGSDASTTLADAGFIDASDAADDIYLTLSVDGEQVQIEIDEADTVQHIIDEINNSTVLNGAITASFNDTTNQLDLIVGQSIRNVEIKFEATTDIAGGDTVDVAFGFGSGATGYGSITGGNTQQLSATAASIGEYFTFTTASADVTQLQTDFNEVRTQIDNLVEDGGYRGVNLLKSDNLETTFNEDRTNSLITEGVDFTVAGIGISTANFISKSAVDSALTELRAAKASVRSFGSSIANDLAVIQTREDFAKATVNTLGEGADKLTLADPNEESANMLALQTRQQLGFVSLSIASQAAQGVLRLF